MSGQRGGRLTDGCPLASVDRLLNPASRAHMALEEQLRELLEKLDLTCSMKSSGSRSKRAKLLKREIAIIRHKLSQRHSPPAAAESGTAGLEDEGARPGQEPGEEGKRSCGAAAVGSPKPARLTHGVASSVATESQAQGQVVVSWVLRNDVKRTARSVHSRRGVAGRR